MPGVGCRVLAASHGLEPVVANTSRACNFPLVSIDLGVACASMAFLLASSKVASALAEIPLGRETEPFVVM